MKAITLRNLPPRLSRQIETLARELGLSINKTVIRLLEERLGTAKHRAEREILYNDLDDLAGAWTVEEARAFERDLKRQRRIDKELWD